MNNNDKNINDELLLLKEKVKQLDKLKKIEQEESELNDKLKKQIEELNAKLNNLEKNENKKDDEIKLLKKENEELKQNMIKNKDDLKKLEIERNKYVNIEEKNNLEKDPLEFYDTIININSIQNIKKDGWEIFMNEEGKKIAESKEKEERLVIGVMGNRNKGKSFMLQALSGIVLQTGTTVSTIGLSIKYLENKYVLLDCAGSESPLLGENANMLEISRDKLFTEAFLESYILRKCNVLLLVIGILSFSEQKLINKISQDLEKLKEKEKKNLIIIHNLQTYETVSQVEKYINDILLKSASFNIIRDESNFGDNSDISEYFYDKENHSIKHFIYAKENSQAGEKYNKHTINSIKSLYRISTNKYKYDYKETIIDHFKYMSEKMFDLSGKSELELVETNENEKEEISNIEKKDEINENKKNEDEFKKVSEDSLIDKKNIKFSSKLIFKGEEKLVLQKMVIDELGISSFIKNDFTPDY